MSQPKYLSPVVGTQIGARRVVCTETRRGPSGSILWLMACPKDHEQWCDASKLAHGEAQTCAECVRVERRARHETKRSESRAMMVSRLSSTQAPLQVRIVADRLDRERRAVMLGEVAAWLGVDPRRAHRYLKAATKSGRARLIPGDVRTPDRWISALVVEPATQREGVAA